MNESGLNFFQRIYKSVADFTFYRQVINEPLKKAVIYFVLFVLLMGGISTIRPIYDFNQKITTLSDNYENKIPDFSFSNGLLKISGEMPIVIEDRHSTVIIDTTGKTDESILDQYKEGVLFLNDRMISKSGSNLQTTNYSVFQTVNLDKNDLGKLIPILRWVSVFIAIFVIIVFVAGKFISALLVSLIGLIVNGILNTKLSYKNLFALSMYSLTLPIILKVGISLLPFKVWSFGMVYYVLAGFYIWYSIYTYKKDTQMQIQ